MGEAFHWAGLAVSVAVAFFLIPLLLMAVVFGGPTLLASLFPRKWRCRYRMRRPREEQRSAYIPSWLRRVVLAADRSECVYCRYRWRHFGEAYQLAQLQIDHCKPWAGGYLTALWNLFVLCGTHNRIKSNYSQDRDGYEHYRSFRDADNKAMAADMVRVEQRARRNPLRWLRAAQALGWLF
jgi:5-methylcytosine-specific restriction endonuclease McrA